MSARTIFSLVIAVAGCASGSSGSSEPAPEASTTTFVPPPPTASAVSAAPIETASASTPAEPPPYPEDAISRARSTNGKLSCAHLIYKRGCAEKRTGHVDLELTLDGDGKVTAVRVLDNKIHNEPEVIEKCLKDSMPQWVFDPPGNAKTTFAMTMFFGDKC